MATSLTSIIWNFSSSVTSTVSPGAVSGVKSLVSRFSSEPVADDAAASAATRGMEYRILCDEESQEVDVLVVLH